MGIKFQVDIEKIFDAGISDRVFQHSTTVDNIDQNHDNVIK